MPFLMAQRFTQRGHTCDRDVYGVYQTCRGRFGLDSVVSKLSRSHKNHSWGSGVISSDTTVGDSFVLRGPHLSAILRQLSQENQ